MTKTIVLTIDNPVPEIDNILHDLQPIADMLAKALVGNEYFLGETMTVEAKVSLGDEMGLVESQPVDISKPKVYRNKYSDRFDAKKDEHGVTTWLPKEQDKE